MTSFSEPVPFEYVEVEKLYKLIADAPRELECCGVLY